MANFFFNGRVSMNQHNKAPRQASITLGLPGWVPPAYQDVQSSPFKTFPTLVAMHWPHVHRPCQRAVKEAIPQFNPF